MKKLVIIESDNSVSQDMAQSLERYTEVKVRVDILASLEEFKAKYIDKTLPDLLESTKDADQKPLRLEENEFHPQIDLLFIADEFLGDNPKGGIKFITETLSKNSYSTEENPCYLVILGYYFEDLHLHEYEHNGVVDFLFKPIDQQLFLQKVEVAFKLGEKFDPSFLAKSSIEEKIAIGKLGKIEEISEFGLAVRNPRPIKPGQFARFYSKVFFCKASPSLLARCYMNIPHPDSPNEFLSYFSYFGIRREQLLNIRKHMQRDSSLKRSSLHEDAVNEMELVDFSATKKDIIVIDNDPSSEGYIKEVYQQAFKNVEIHSFNSYTAFVKEIINSKSETNPLDDFNKFHQLGIYSQIDEEVEKKKKKKDKKEEDQTPKLSERFRAVPIDDKLILEISKDEQKLVRISQVSGRPYNVFGHTHQELKSDPELWKTFIHEMSADEFAEYLEICLAGQQGRLDLWGISKDTSPARIRIECQNKPNTIQLSISDVTHEYKPDKNEGKKKTIDKVFAIYIDGSMIRSDDKNEFIKNLRKMIKKAGLKPDGKKVKINILGLEDGETRASHYEADEVDDFFYRPLDRSLILQKMMLYVFPFEQELAHNNLQYFENSHSMVLSTFVKMVQVSEHGIAVRYKIPFKQGTFMRFISNIFYLDNGDPLIGRCYYSEKEDSSEDFISYFEFFGVTDEVFKRIRVWMRESYVESKQAS